MLLNYAVINIIFLLSLSYGGICPHQQVLMLGQPPECQEAWGAPNYPGDYPGCPKNESQQCVCEPALWNGVEIKRMFVSVNNYIASCTISENWESRCPANIGIENFMNNATHPRGCQPWCPGFGLSEEQCQVDAGVAPGCTCISGYLRGPHGLCMAEVECPLLCPKQNEKPRDESDPHTCENSCSGFSYCPNPPSPCICKDGYIRLEQDGLCIKDTLCLPPPAMTTCLNRCGEVHNSPMRINTFGPPQFPFYGNQQSGFSPFQYPGSSMYGNQPGFPMYGNQHGFPVYGNQHRFPINGNQHGFPIYGNQHNFPSMPFYGSQQVSPGHSYPNPYYRSQFQPSSPLPGIMAVADGPIPYRACSCDDQCPLVGDCCSDFVDECPTVCPCDTVDKCRCYYEAAYNDPRIHLYHYHSATMTSEEMARVDCGC